MGLGDMVAGMLGDDSANRSSLQGFLSKFNSSEGKWVDTIDTLQTFDISFAFYPMLTPQGNGKKGFMDKLLGAAKNAVVGAAKNLLNNVTGGLLGAFLNDVDIMGMQKNWVGDSNFGSTTSMDYIARGNLLVNNEGSLGGAKEDAETPQLILDLSYYVQNVTLPQIITKDEGNVETMMGDFPVNGKCVKPSQNSFSMEVINTKSPILEKIFYPWMREVTLPYWSYDTQPYTTADVTISFEKHADMKYVFVGSRPSNIMAMNGSNELGSPIRTISFNFDYMFVLSELKACESAKDKLIGLGKGLLNGAGSTLGL